MGGAGQGRLGPGTMVDRGQGLIRVQGLNRRQASDLHAMIIRTHSAQPSDEAPGISIFGHPETSKIHRSTDQNRFKK